MSNIEIFEAAGCCAASSVVVSDEAVEWNASAEWAKKMALIFSATALRRIRSSS